MSLIWIIVGSAFIPAPPAEIILILFCTQYVTRSTLASILSMQSMTQSGFPWSNFSRFCLERNISSYSTSIWGNIFLANSTAQATYQKDLFILALQIELYFRFPDFFSCSKCMTIQWRKSDSVEINDADFSYSWSHQRGENVAILVTLKLSLLRRAIRVTFPLHPFRPLWRKLYKWFLGSFLRKIGCCGWAARFWSFDNPRLIELSRFKVKCLHVKSIFWNASCKSPFFSSLELLSLEERRLEEKCDKAL